MVTRERATKKKIFIGVFWINFPPSFIHHPQAWVSFSRSRFIIFICILYLLFTWQHSSRSPSLTRRDGERWSKKASARPPPFCASFAAEGGTNAHNILWWTLLRTMMITIIIMNIFSPFCSSSDKWTSSWSLRKRLILAVSTTLNFFSFLSSLLASSQVAMRELWSKKNEKRVGGAKDWIHLNTENDFELFLLLYQLLVMRVSKGEEAKICWNLLKSKCE
jgi:hypothetical protein